MKIFGLTLSSQHFLALAVAAPLALGVAQAAPISAHLFAANAAITETIEPINAPPCILQGDITGKGFGSELGKLTLASQDCINPISQTEFSFSTNQLVLTGTNG